LNVRLNVDVVVRPLSMCPPKPRRSRLKPVDQPKLFEGSLEEYIEVSRHVPLSSVELMMEFHSYNVYLHQREYFLPEEIP